MGITIVNNNTEAKGQHFDSFEICLKCSSVLYSYTGWASGLSWLIEYGGSDVMGHLRLTHKKGLTTTFLASEDLRHHIARKPKLAHRERPNRVALIGLLNERSAEVSVMLVARLE